MKDKEEMISQILNQVSEELNITKTMYEKAVKSYEAVGKWIGGMDEDLNICASPQGSFNLGTVVRPLTNKDDGYDIDLVCNIEEAIDWDEYRIKNSIGDRLKENELYDQEMLDKEGKRCWTLQYDGFHMDILPCTPKKYLSNDIRLTHKNENGVYESRYSNPCEYRKWFLNQMKPVINEQARKEVYASMKIDDVPLYTYRTPLQKSIQILKRHRDIMYENNYNDAPISIIITTLAAMAYNNEVDLYEALKNIVENIPKMIIYSNEEYKILNPVMKEENFADKWKDDPTKAENFFAWIETVKKDIIENPISLIGIDEISKPLNKAFGEELTKRALNNYGEDLKLQRNNNNLYMNGLAGGVSIGKQSNGSQKIDNHTFFG